MLHVAAVSASVSIFYLGPAKLAGTQFCRTAVRIAWGARGPEFGSGASADNSLRSAAEALKGTLVNDGKRLEIRHFCFAACESSVRQEVFAGPKSLMHQNPGGRRRGCDSSLVRKADIRYITCPNSGHEYFISDQSAVRVAGTFPQAAIEVCIRDALAMAHDSQRLLRPRVASACEPEVDSLVVVEVMCAIEQLLGVVLPTSFVPRGGYDDIEACVSDLVSRVRAVWVELVKEVEEHHV